MHKEELIDRKKEAISGLKRCDEMIQVYKHKMRSIRLLMATELKEKRRLECILKEEI